MAVKHDHIRILVVEDSPDDYLLTRYLLVKAQRSEYALDWAQTFEQGLEALRRQQYDVCLLDYQIGRYTATEFLREISSANIVTPVIVLTGSCDPQLEEEVLHAGADDHLTKSGITAVSLAQSVRHALQRARFSVALRESEQLLRASLDALTSHIAILDGTGRTQLRNTAWSELPDEHPYRGPLDCAKVDYLEVCRQAAEAGRPEAGELSDGLRAVLAGERAAFSMEYSYGTGTSEQWFTLRIHSFAAGSSSGAVVTHENITSRVRAERGVRASERRFRALIENGGDHIGLLLSDGRNVYASPSTQRLLGYPAEVLEGQNVFEIVHPDDLDRTKQTFAEVLSEGGEPQSVELRARHHAGHWVWLESVVTNLLDDADVRAVVVNSRDISERKQAEEALRASEEFARQVLDHSTDCIQVLDLDGRQLFMSQAGQRALGTGADCQPACRSWIGLWDESTRPAAQAAFQVALAGGEGRFEGRITTADGGSTFWDVAVTPILHSAGRPERLLSVSRDVTARRNGELALRESERRYRELFHSALDLVYSLDTSGKVLDVNRAAEQALGYTREELRGLDIRTLIAPEYHHRLQHLRDDGLSNSRDTVYDVEFICRNGQRLAIEVNTTPLYQNGQPAGMLGIGRDVTERWRNDRFEQERRRILEQVAQHRPLDEILDRIAALVEQQYAGTSCEIQVFRTAALGRTPIPSEEQDVIPGSRPVRNFAATAPRMPLQQHQLTTGERRSWPLLSAAGSPLGMLTVAWQGIHTADRTAQVIEKAVQLASLTIEHRQLNDKLAYQAQHDVLTGLPNRLLFADRLTQALTRARQHNLRVVVLYVDLDNFKCINDSLGHHAGDQVLRIVSERLQSKLRHSDTLARIGGDELAIILPDLPGVDAGKLVAQRVLEVFQQPLSVEGHSLAMTASIGASAYPRDGQTWEALLQCADSAMFRVKRDGKNGYHAYAAGMDQQSRRQSELQADLHEALERGEFSLAFQPQIDLNSGMLAGFEVLLRWQHPRYGMIPPATFIPLAEESGKIISLGAWVLEQACRQGQQWQRDNYLPVRMGVNVSALQFARRDWAKSVADVLTRTGLPACFLDLELTESVVMHNVNESVRSMNKLRKMGVGLSIDDFGTGYSSLAHLERLPIDRLKIDVSFVREIKPHRHDVPLVRAIVGLARSLGIKVVAEGLETRHQLEVLRNLGCDEVQGYLIGRPLTAEAATKVLAEASAAPVLLDRYLDAVD